MIVLITKIVGSILFVSVCTAQSIVPHFTVEGAIPFQSGKPRLLAPGMILTIYGDHLAPQENCPEAIPQNGPYPEEACGVKVLVGDRPAGLLYVSFRQLNFKIPEDAPAEGTAAIQVCVRESCSGAVPFRFSAFKSYVHVQGPARAGMPIWIELEQPMPYDIRYPFQPWPWNFDGYQVELRYEGNPVTPLHADGAVGTGWSVAPPDSPQSRLPLHMHYRLDRPGRYSVRVTLMSLQKKVLNQSDWTDFTVETFPEDQRDAWLADLARRIPSATPGQLVGDLLPSLLAKPDEKALAVLLPLLHHADPLVEKMARYSLNCFEDAVLLGRMTREEIRALRMTGYVM